MLNFSESARAKVLELMNAETRQGLALRFGIRGRGPGGFLYRLSFVEDGDRTPTDSAVDAGGVIGFVDAASAPPLPRATVHLGYADASGVQSYNLHPPLAGAQ